MEKADIIEIKLIFQKEKSFNACSLFIKHLKMQGLKTLTFLFCLIYGYTFSKVWNK